MSYQEKMSLLTIAATIGISAVYYGFVYQDYNTLSAEADKFDFWATAIVLMLPVYIVAHLVIILVFTFFNKRLTGEGFPKHTDERDKIIQLKTLRGNYFGVLASLFLAM